MDQRLEGTVSITTTDSIGNLLFPDILKKLLELYPGLNIDLQVGIQYRNLNKSEADIAIRIALFPQPTFVDRQIGTLNFALYASEEASELIAEFTRIEGIIDGTFILLDASSSSIPIDQWLEENSTCAEPEWVLLYCLTI